MDLCADPLPLGTKERYIVIASWPLLPDTKGSARFEGNDHRIWLERRWGSLNAPFVLHIGMNPSLAGAENDDLTVRKDQEFTKRMGFDRMVKVNVGTYISTDPDGLNRCLMVAHEINLPTIRTYAAAAARIIVATGRPPDVLVSYARVLFKALKQDGRHMECFGLTKDHWPKHSSRLAYVTPLQEFVW
jgi:hypothetical protein